MAECEICGLFEGRHAAEFHRLADRIAKLEARNEHFNCSHGADASDCPKPAAAGPILPGYKLAPGWSLARPPYAHCLRYYHDGQGRYCGSDGVIECGNARICVRHAIDKAALVKVEPPAEQPASAADDVPVTQASPETIAAVHAMTAKLPPAPSQGAPAEPLSKDINGWATHARVQELEARIATAERERDEALVSIKQAVAAERERCWAFAKYRGTSWVEEAIRDGRPAPK